MVRHVFFFPSTKVSWTEGRLIGLETGKNGGLKEARSAGTGPQSLCGRKPPEPRVM